MASMTIQDREPTVAGTLSQVNVGTALRRHRLLAVLPVILLVIGAVAAGYARSPQYTAETRLGVGRIDASSPASLAGFQQVTQVLAETYSRSVLADDIINATAAKLKLPRREVRSHISATPIPDSPVFRVIGTGSTAKSAMELSNGISAAFVNKSEATSAATPQGNRLLDQYSEAIKQVTSLRQIADARREDLDADKTAANRRALADAQAKVGAAAVRADALQTAYTNSVQTAGAASVVQVIQAARSATSDRRRVLELLLFIGAVAGVAIGLALAIAASARELRRAFS
jgi:capsular polysaccharide biosynthesis protein